MISQNDAEKILNEASLPQDLKETIKELLPDLYELNEQIKGKYNLESNEAAEQILKIKYQDNMQKKFKVMEEDYNEEDFEVLDLATNVFYDTITEMGLSEYLTEKRKDLYRKMFKVFFEDLNEKNI